MTKDLEYQSDPKNRHKNTDIFNWRNNYLDPKIEAS